VAVTRRLKRSVSFRVGLVLVALLVAFAVLGPVVAPRDPFTSDFARAVSPDEMPVGPTRDFWLGADLIYRDQFARLALGARYSLVIGVVATLLATSLGALVGVVAGYYEGARGVRVGRATVVALAAAFVAWIYVGNAPAIALAAVAIASTLPPIAKRAERLGGVELDADGVLMRAVDVLLAFPFLLLVMAIGAAFERTSPATILFVLGVTGWLGTARVVRAKVMQIRHLEFVTAARSLGQSTPRILLRHVLPNISGPLVVIATVSVAQMILAESVLSYLGAGMEPPTPTWGHMLFEGQDAYTGAPWLLWAPAALILASVLGFNLLGEGLRDALDA
jgi:ABC-type dipeptide/oligopeptide/nickel transport system permease subunit